MPSDPEEGSDWSSDSESEAPNQQAQAEPSQPQGQREVQEQQKAQENQRGRSATTAKTSPQKPGVMQNSPAALSDASQSMLAPKERKRNTSSSSAFGSRARVRYSNLRKAHRRRPLSLQAALQSLTSGNDSDDLAKLAREHRCQGMGGAFERRSFQGPVDIAKSRGVQTGEEDDTEDKAFAASHSSAPAATSVSEQHNLAQAEKVWTPARNDDGPVPSQPVAATPSADKPATSAGPEENKKPKFFLSTSADQHSDEEQEAEPEENVRPVAAKAPSTGAAGSSNAVAHMKQASMDSESTAEAHDESQPTPAETSVMPPSPPSQKPSQNRNDLHGARNRSGHNLHKAAGKGKGASGSHKHSSSSRLSALHGLGMTKAQPAPAAPATGKNPTKPAQQPPVSSMKKANKQVKKPVKFALGGDDDEDEEDDDDGFEDEDEDEIEGKGQEGSKANVAVKESSAVEELPRTSSAQRQTTPAGASIEPPPPPEAEEEVVDDEDDDDDAWASDASAELEDQRRQAQEMADKRRRFEEQRQQEMFKKIPLRTQSAADVRLLAGEEEAQKVSPALAPVDGNSADDPLPQQAPVRGLLSSLFHPDLEPHSPPGQLHGRAHASAANLGQAARQSRPTASRSTTAEGAPMARRPTEERSRSRQRHQHHQHAAHEHHHHRPPSLILGTSFGDHGGPLRTSKSAAALPVLNVTAPKVSATHASGDARTKKSSEEEDDDGGVGIQSGSLVQQVQAQQQPPPSSSELSQSSAGRVGDTRHKRASAGPETSRERKVQGSIGSSSSSSTAQGSGISAAAPEPLPTTAVASHRTSLPEPMAPQTPRTTRRNMLRDELSESLRQNLLWERQSRNRMLGIGANGPRPQEAASTASNAPGSMGPPPARNQRRETVLSGGGTLRPLTQSGQGASSSRASGDYRHEQQQPPQQQQQQRHSGQKHHHSRSTPSLAHLNPDPGRHPHHQHHHHPHHVQVHRDAARRQLSSAETTDDEGEQSSRGGTGLYGVEAGGNKVGPGGVSSETSSLGSPRTTMMGGGAGGGAGGAGDGGSSGRDDEQRRKKKTMWPGGFPDYHQHGW